MAMGQKPVPPVKIPIPTKIDYNGWCSYPKMVPLVLTHSHIPKSNQRPGAWSEPRPPTCATLSAASKHIFRFCFMCFSWERGRILF